MTAARPAGKGTLHMWWPWGHLGAGAGMSRSVRLTPPPLVPNIGSVIPGTRLAPSASGALMGFMPLSLVTGRFLCC